MSSNLTLLDQVNSSLFSFTDNSEVYITIQGENRVCIDAREDILFDAIETFTLFGMNHASYSASLKTLIRNWSYLVVAGHFMEIMNLDYG